MFQGKPESAFFKTLTVTLRDQVYFKNNMAMD